jgi:CRP-like cAMP-binding protein
MSLKDDIALLSRVPLFASMNEDQLRLLAFGAQKQQLAAGQSAFVAGARAQSALVIAKGRMALSVPEKGASRRLQDAGPATMLCELALISDIECPVSATALDDCEVFEISRALFTRLLEEFPDVALSLEARIKANLGALVRDMSGLKRRFS